MHIYDDIALAIPDVLLPKAGADWQRWAVVACDQYSSEPEYWARAKAAAEGAPSALKLIYPEAYLNEADPEARIANIQQAMQDYLQDGVLQSTEGMIFVQRQTSTGLRQGLVAALDLEAYDYHKGSGTLVRATEGTIEDRLPPRMRIRRGAKLELPHIMVLIDDPEKTVIEPLAQVELTDVYDFELMEGAGHIKGQRLSRAQADGVAEAIRALAEPAAFSKKYGQPEGAPVLLYAMGDGNHSLATAKAIYEEEKQKDAEAAKNSALRYALIELVNLHDPSLVFEPIHRVLFELADPDGPLNALAAAYEERFSYEAVADGEAMVARVNAQTPGSHLIGVIRDSGYGLVRIDKPSTGLAEATLQQLLDPFIAEGGAKEIDYVHGRASAEALARRPGNIGFYLPGIDKDALFKAVIQDGALPRKTFSMGEADDKRFYIEARQISG